MNGLAFALALVLALLAAPAHAQDPPTSPGHPVIAAAGDIACDPASTSFNGGLGTATRCRQMATSDLLVGAGLTAVLPLGDNQYENGTLAQYQASYDPSWGRVKELTRPVPGNHEYSVTSGSPTGSGYFDYFNGVANQSGAAGDRARGYYSFDIGDWHLVALNSVCEEVGGCAAESAQEQWLRADLAQNTRSCTIAYWHHPRFTSDPTVANPVSEELYRVLYEAGAEVVLNGHAHSYERFAPQDPDGVADATFGIRQFVVGTGGRNLTDFGPPLPNSEVRDNTSFGLLTLTLKPNGYDWEFVRESGASGDSGTENCHGAPAAQAPSAATGPATSTGDAPGRLTAAVNPRGQATTYRFEYGPTPSYGSATADTAIGVTTSTAQQVGATVPDLTPGVTYHYRVVAQSGAGTTAGDDRTFTAGGPASRYAAAVEGTTGLLSYWRLGEEGGGFTFDRRGSRLGSFRGGGALGEPGALVGDADTAAGFDGANGELRLTGPSLTRFATIEGWFRWTAGTSLMRDDSWGGGWALAYEHSPGVLGYRVTNKNFVTSASIGSVRDGAWHHLALTKNGGTTALYVDGALVHTEGGASNRASTAPWHVMRHGQEALYAAGRADEIAMYETPLSARAIKGHYDVGRGDLTPPETDIGSGPEGPTNQTSASFGFTSSEGLSVFRCRLDGPGAPVGTEVDCAPPRQFGPLADGTHTFRVHAIDPAGNPDPTPATRTFTVDTAAPETTIDTGPAEVGSATTAAFEFSSSEGASTFRCALDGPGVATGAEVDCQAPEEFSSLTDGAYTFRVHAIDSAGNADPTPAARAFTVDTTAPDTGIVFGPSGTTAETGASFEFTSSEPSSFECRLDGGAWAACASPTAVSGLAPGEHSFDVRSTDAAGNVDGTPATRAWTIQRPAAPADNPPGEPGPVADDPPLVIEPPLLDPEDLGDTELTPTAFRVATGRLLSTRTPLFNLSRNDERHFRVSAKRLSRRRFVVDFSASLVLTDSERQSLRQLSITHDGGTSRSPVTLVVSVYDYAAGGWLTLSRERRRTTRDRAFEWTSESDPRDYVSDTGKLRMRVRATGADRFRSRTDLLSVTVAR